jgi:hypothetical protein
MPFTYLETIKKTLETAGSFVLKKKTNRKGRNPQTGKPITITARKVLTFKLSTVLNASLNKECRNFNLLVHLILFLIYKYLLTNRKVVE